MTLLSSKIIVGIFLFIFILLLISFIELLDAKKKLYRSQAEITIDYTNSVLNMISDMIQVEIVMVLRSYMMLGLRYEVSNLDDDIQIISKNIFNGFNKTIFINKNCVLTSEYLFNYIIRKTTLELMSTVRQYNSNVETHISDVKDS